LLEVQDDDTEHADVKFSCINS